MEAQHTKNENIKPKRHLYLFLLRIGDDINMVVVLNDLLVWGTVE
jgi:hypothetical protein